MIYHNIQQGSDEWHLLRATRFTASNFHKLFMKESTKTYQNYINEIVFARLTGEPTETYQSEWMKRGSELEPQAIEAYELESFNKVRPMGFIELDEYVGCSPDGLVGENGMIQIKCPLATTIMDYKENKIPNEYYIQMQGELFISNRKWSEFFVYHPKLKPISIGVIPDKETIKQIQLKLSDAIKLVNERVKKWQ